MEYVPTAEGVHNELIHTVVREPLLEARCVTVMLPKGEKGVQGQFYDIYVELMKNHFLERNRE